MRQKLSMRFSKWILGHKRNELRLPSRNHIWPKHNSMSEQKLRQMKLSANSIILQFVTLQRWIVQTLLLQTDTTPSMTIRLFRMSKRREPSLHTLPPKSLKATSFVIRSWLTCMCIDPCVLTSERVFQMVSQQNARGMSSWLHCHHGMYRCTVAQIITYDQLNQ